VADPLFEPDQR
jgi:hypothetical protein